MSGLPLNFPDKHWKRVSQKKIEIVMSMLV